jgi:hypothetical protein
MFCKSLLSLAVVAWCAGTAIAQEPDQGVRFSSAAYQERYDRLRACVLDRVPTGWLHERVSSGMWAEERWCRPATGRTRCDEPLAPDRYVLRTITGQQEKLELLATRVDAADGWGVGVSIQAWTGGFDLWFTKGRRRLDLGTHFTYQNEPFANIAITPVGPTGDSFTWLDLGLSAYLASAVAFRDAALRGLGLLRAAVSDQVGRGGLSLREDLHAQGCMVEFEGAGGASGWKDSCPRRRLTLEENQAVLTRCRRELDAREELVRRNYVSLHAALMATLPLDRCWPSRSPGTE